MGELLTVLTVNHPKGKHKLSVNWNAEAKRENAQRAHRVREFMAQSDLREVQEVVMEYCEQVGSDKSKLWIMNDDKERLKERLEKTQNDVHPRPKLTRQESEKNLQPRPKLTRQESEKPLHVAD